MLSNVNVERKINVNNLDKNPVFTKVVVKILKTTFGPPETSEAETGGCVTSEAGPS